MFKHLALFAALIIGGCATIKPIPPKSCKEYATDVLNAHKAAGRDLVDSKQVGPKTVVLVFVDLKQMTSAQYEIFSADLPADKKPDRLQEVGSCLMEGELAPVRHFHMEAPIEIESDERGPI